MISKIFGAVGGFALAAASLAAPSRAASPEGFSSPRPGASLTPGSVVETRWHPLDAGAAAERDEAELVLSLDGGRTFPVRVSSEMPPGASSYRWRVPALPAGSARLALRVGTGRERGRERIVLVSGAFTIASAPPEPQALSSGPEESWTEQALFERTPGDLLGGAMRAVGERLVLPESGEDAENPRPPALLGSGTRAATSATVPSVRASAPRRVAPRASASVPLRL